MRALALLSALTTSLVLLSPAAAQDNDVVAPAPHVHPKLRVLLIDGQNNHNWRATTPWIVAILENSARFDVKVHSAIDVSKFDAQFDKFDVVVSNYNGRPWPKKTCEAFERYVRAGGGFVSVHAANNAFAAWPAYNAMIGVGGWCGRNEKSGPYVRFKDGKITLDMSKGRGGSHGRQHEFVVKHRSAHPILDGLPEAWLHAQDELYDRLRGPAQNLSVLATAFSDKKTGGSGVDEPMLMTVRFGKGRIFHTTLGHSVLAMRGLGFQNTLQRGTEWAASGEVTIAPPPKGALTLERCAKFDALAEARKRAGWVQLFDGKSLDGWTQRNGTAKYRIQGDMIVGRTNEGSPNSFLCSDHEYGDFELIFEVKVDNPLNSGVQIRSKTRNGPKGRVHGPQVEIATNGNAGFVYGEALKTGWLKKPSQDKRKRNAFRKGRWNRYRVLAQGKRIRTWINGIAIEDFADERSGMASGLIGLQVHSIGKGQGPFQVRWRDLWIREISK